jgi:uncharacterized repeat protein (TIGR03803 family)
LRYSALISVVVGSFLSVTLTSTRANAATFTTIYSFQGGSDGLSPSSVPAVDGHGVLYGTTLEGGNMECGNGLGCGTAFSLTPPASPGGAWTKTILWVFGGAGDGVGPFGGLTFGSGGVLYGATEGGGSGSCTGGCGTVFSLTPPASQGGAWVEQVVYSFAGGSDGSGPTSGPIAGPEGVLYGTTGGGGTSGDGTVYAITPPEGPGGAWVEAVLYSFKGGVDDGLAPLSVAVGHGGTLYGTTIGGGSKVNAGTVFSLRPPSEPGQSWREKVLYRFNGGRHAAGGESPLTNVVIGSGGELYGTTGDIPTAFSLAPPSQAGGVWTETVLSKSSSLRQPRGNLVLSANGVAMYGTSPFGGSSQSCGDAGCGFVWGLAPAVPPGRVWEVEILHDFGGTDGGVPAGGIIESGGTFYGTTGVGGLYGFGTMFSLVP